MKIGTKLQKIRTDKGISVYKLAQLSDVSENYIHSIEKNQSQPSIAILELLLPCLGTTLSEFFNTSNDNVLYASHDEYELIQNYRNLSQEEQSAILNLVKTFCLK